jgi:hypothetical protein
LMKFFHRKKDKKGFNYKYPETNEILD